MAKMRAVRIPAANGPFEVVDVEIPTPGPGSVRVKVEACGVCHGDNVAKSGHWPGMKFPRVPGHEVVGRIDALGEGVRFWKAGQRVGVGWHGGHCGACDACRRGQLGKCPENKVCGISFDGGYAEYLVASTTALVKLPEGVSSTELAPQLCAGLTTFSALRAAHVRAGDLVAVHGIGGLGHLGVQFARQMGYRVVAVSRGQSKAKESLALGAHDYIDADAGDPAEALQKLGGARVILATAPHAAAVAKLAGGLGRDGQIILVAAPHEPILVNGLGLLLARGSIKGWVGDGPTDAEDTVAFAAQTGVRAKVEVFPLTKAADAFASMMESRVRFRAVLDPTR